MGFIKKVFLLVGAAAVVVIGIRLQERSNRAAQVQAPNLAAPALSQVGGSASASSSPMPAPLSNPPQNIVTKTAQMAKSLAATNPLEKRKLDLPMPKGKRDLLGNLSDLKAPMLPGLNTEDSDVKAVFRGFYEAEPGKYRRIELNRAQNISLAIEDVNQRFPVYQESKGDFDVSNYHEDPYSIVMTLRDMRVVYLKFYSARKIPDYTEPGFRVMSGWVIDGRGPRVARRAALIDGRMAELKDTRDPAQYVWPRLEVLQMLMPAAALGD